MLRFEARDRSLQHLDQALIEQRDTGGRFVFANSSRNAANGFAALEGAKRKVKDLTRNVKLLQILRAVACRNCIRNVDDSLRCLSDRAGRDQFVGCGIDRGHAIGIFQSDIDPAAVAGRPNAVRQLADRDGCDLRKIVGTEGLDLVQSSDRDVSKGTVGIVDNIDMIGDRPGVD